MLQDDEIKKARESFSASLEAQNMLPIVCFSFHKWWDEGEGTQGEMIATTSPAWETKEMQQPILEAVRQWLEEKEKDTP